MVMPRRTYAIAPVRLAEWPATSTLNSSFQLSTISFFVGVAPLLFRNIPQLPSPAASWPRSCLSLTKSDQAHPLQQGDSPQHCSVLATPRPCWSALDCGIYSLTVLLTMSHETCSHLTRESSISRSIQATPQAKANVAIGTLWPPLKLQADHGMDSSVTSGALFTGPLFLVSDFLHSASTLISQASIGWPASTCISFSSLRYWSPEANSAAFSAAATPSTPPFVRGKTGSRPITISANLSTSCLRDLLTAVVLLAQKFLVRPSTAFLRSELLLAISKAFSIEPFLLPFALGAPSTCP